MFRLIAKAFAASALIFASFVVQASETNMPTATYAAVGAPALVPYGWVDFCRRHAEECQVAVLAPRDIALTQQTWALLQRVNTYANDKIVPVSNLEHWGTILDHWDYPTDGKGDCKIYALYKRKLLMDLGFPRQALLMTIVRDENDNGHTILTVKTDHGEFVLDNLSDTVRPWDTTGYRYVKRQAQSDPNLWLDLGGVKGTAAAHAAEAPRTRS